MKRRAGDVLRLPAALPHYDTELVAVDSCRPDQRRNDVRTRGPVAVCDRPQPETLQLLVDLNRQNELVPAPCDQPNLIA
jgi:hypothetical protein